MKPERSLPVLLVSACDTETAEEFISELIDNEVSETGGGGEVERGGGRVWRLVNKYYSADVLVRAHADADPCPAGPGARVEAHVAYFTPEECEAPTEMVVACAERRAGGASGAAVRVAALRAACEEALTAWAARARYEPVPLLEPAEGVARVRAALHAHPWPGLRRLDRSAPVLTFPDSDESSSCGEEGEGEDEGDEVDVERAEQFALALGALGELGGLGGGGGGGALGDAERRQRAEHLLEAFCRALGERLDC